MQRLDPAVLTLWRVGALLWWLFLAAAAAVALLASDLDPVWALAVVAAGGVYTAVVPGKRYARFGYHVGDVDLRLRRGWVWQASSVVLHARVQHVDTRRGPLENLLGLATVVVFTAGTVGAMLAIPGLRLADAEALRDRLIALSGSDDAV
jgi:uncharacterized protein